MWFVFLEPVKAKNNFEYFDFGHKAFRVLTRVPMVMMKDSVSCCTGSRLPSATLICQTHEGLSGSLANLANQSLTRDL